MLGSENHPMSAEASAKAAMPFHDTSETSSNKRKMFTGIVPEGENGPSKKGRGQFLGYASTLAFSFQPSNKYPADLYPQTVSPDPLFAKSTFSEQPRTSWPPTTSTSPFPSSTPSTTSPLSTTRPYHKWNSPFPATTTLDPPSNSQQALQTALSEATRRAALAERKAADYRQLSDHSTLEAVKSTNEHLTTENKTLKEAYAKLEKHAKNCEKATAKAQKDAQNAKGYADHTVKSQKGRLKSAERRCEDAMKELKEWRGRYGLNVENPGRTYAALQIRSSEWQSMAEKGQNEISTLREKVLLLEQQQQQQQSSHNDAGEESQSGTMAEQHPPSIKAEGIHHGRSVEAEAQAKKHKYERNLLSEVVRHEMGRNARLAESLLLRNAELKELLGGVVDGRW